MHWRRATRKKTHTWRWAMTRALAARGTRWNQYLREKKRLAVGHGARHNGARTIINEKEWIVMNITRWSNHVKRLTSSYFNYFISQRDQNHPKTNMRVPSRINVIHVDVVCAKFFCMPRCSPIPTRWINTIWRKRARLTFYYLFSPCYIPLPMGGGMSKYYFDRGA